VVVLATVGLHPATRAAERHLAQHGSPAAQPIGG
jgi:hypothetical protein